GLFSGAQGEAGVDAAVGPLLGVLDEPAQVVVLDLGGEGGWEGAGVPAPDWADPRPPLDLGGEQLGHAVPQRRDDAHPGDDHATLVHITLTPFSREAPAERSAPPHG